MTEKPKVTNEDRIKQLLDIYNKHRLIIINSIKDIEQVDAFIKLDKFVVDVQLIEKK